MLKALRNASVVAAILLAQLAGPAFAANPDVDIKLAAKYCEAAQEARGGAVDVAALSACMREFGYSRIRFGAGARF